MAAAAATAADEAAEAAAEAVEDSEADEAAAAKESEAAGTAAGAAAEAAEEAAEENVDGEGGAYGANKDESGNAVLDDMLPADDDADADDGRDAGGRSMLRTENGSLSSLSSLSIPPPPLIIRSPFPSTNADDD